MVNCWLGDILTIRRPRRLHLVVKHDQSVTVYRVSRISEVTVSRRSSFDVIVIVKPQPCHYVLERCTWIRTAYVTDKQCHTNSYSSRDQKEKEHCLTGRETDFFVCVENKKRNSFYSYDKLNYTCILLVGDLWSITIVNLDFNSILVPRSSICMST